MENHRGHGHWKGEIRSSGKSRRRLNGLERGLGMKMKQTIYPSYLLPISWFHKDTLAFGFVRCPIVRSPLQQIHTDCGACER